MYLGDRFEWDFIHHTKFVWVKTKSGKYRVWDYTEHQGTTGGGRVVNGQYCTADSVVRDLSGNILNFKTKAEAEAYARKLKS